MNRTINTHAVNPANEALKVTVIDEPGQGGASHAYLVTGADFAVNPGIQEGLAYAAETGLSGAIVLFQNGPIGEAGPNGLTHEVLLAIVADRLRGFQAGVYACFENGEALTHVEAALWHLQSRTRARQERGVEGTHKV